MFKLPWKHRALSLVTFSGLILLMLYSVSGLTQHRIAFQLPFPCGTKVHINCAYGPQCSRAHRNQDQYALDFSVVARGGSFKKDVLSTAKGNVVFAGWAPGSFSYYGKIVLIEHPQGRRGKERLFSLYAHLHRVLVNVGDSVDELTTIGQIGGSSRGKLKHLGSHLHFAIMRGKSVFFKMKAILPEPLGVYRALDSKRYLIACAH